MDMKVIDKSKFINSAYRKVVKKPWGYEVIFTTTDLPYTGKVMHVNAGTRQSLQVHDKKIETYWLAKGRGGVMIENTKGEMETMEFETGKGYTTKIGQKHRIFGITDCDIWEVSTPEIGTTYRLEDDYKRTDETEEARKKERNEI